MCLLEQLLLIKICAKNKASLLEFVPKLYLKSNLLYICKIHKFKDINIYIYLKIY